MQTIKPFDLNDCLQLINQRRDEIINGSCDILINQDWVNAIDHSDLLLLAKHCPSSPRVIADKTTSPELLRSLAKVPQCLLGVARNKHTPSDAFAVVLKTFLVKSDQFIRSNNFLRSKSADGFIRSNNFPETEVAAQAQEVMAVWIINSQYGAVETDKYIVQASVAKNPNTPVNVLQELADDPEPNVRMAVAENPNTPMNMLQKLANDSEPEVRKAIASNPSTPVRLLELLARDDEREIRCAVATNSQTPANVLADLARDDDFVVIRNVSQNKNTPREVLEHLARSHDWLVRGNVASHPRTSTNTLEILATDFGGDAVFSADVRAKVAANLSTPASVLERLANDPSSEVRERVAKNPNTSKRALRTLKNHGKGTTSTSKPAKDAVGWLGLSLVIAVIGYLVGGIGGCVVRVGLGHGEDTYKPFDAFSNEGLYIALAIVAVGIIGAVISGARR